MTSRASMLTAMALVALPIGRATAQQPAPPSGKCQLQFESNPKTRVSFTQQPSGEYNTYLGGGVRAHCPAQNMTLIADSAQSLGDQRVLYLIGHVHYTEPRLTLTSHRLTYYMATERIVAEGDVHSRLPSGTTMVGPRAEYFRAVPGVRTQAHMVSTGRPTFKIIQVDSSGKPAEPMTVIANRVATVADSLVFASGRVEMTRPDVVAHGDSAAVDSGHEFARLMRKPSIEARGDRPFTLSGTVIDLFGQNRLLRRVLSKGSAKAVSQDATITADTLDFRMADGRLQRAFAWGPSRAHATSPTYDIVADSLDVRMPDQRLREVDALRDALAESRPDTTVIRTSTPDRLHGDTIFAYFDTTRSAPAAHDDSASGSGPAIQRLVARGHARSFYQIAPHDSATAQPSINYVRGRDITVAFADRRVSRVTITDQAAGVYLEPAPPAADSGAARTDTAATPSTARTDTTATPSAKRPRRPEP